MRERIVDMNIAYRNLITSAMCIWMLCNGQAYADIGDKHTSTISSAEMVVDGTGIKSQDIDKAGVKSDRVKALTRGSDGEMSEDSSKMKVTDLIGRWVHVEAVYTKLKGENLRNLKKSIKEKLQEGKSIEEIREETKKTIGKVTEGIDTKLEFRKQRGNLCATYTIKRDGAFFPLSSDVAGESVQWIAADTSMTEKMIPWYLHIDGLERMDKTSNDGDTCLLPCKVFLSTEDEKSVVTCLLLASRSSDGEIISHAENAISFMKKDDVDRLFTAAMVSTVKREINTVMKGE